MKKKKWVSMIYGMRAFLSILGCFIVNVKVFSEVLNYCNVFGFRMYLKIGWSITHTSISDFRASFI